MVGTRRAVVGVCGSLIKARLCTSTPRGRNPEGGRKEAGEERGESAWQDVLVRGAARAGWSYLYGPCVCYGPKIRPRAVVLLAAPVGEGGAPLLPPAPQPAVP